MAHPTVRGRHPGRRTNANCRPLRQGAPQGNSQVVGSRPQTYHRPGDWNIRSPRGAKRTGHLYVDLNSRQLAGPHNLPQGNFQIVDSRPRTYRLAWNWSSRSRRGAMRTGHRCVEPNSRQLADLHNPLQVPRRIFLPLPLRRLNGNCLLRGIRPHRRHGTRRLHPHRGSLLRPRHVRHPHVGRMPERPNRQTE